MECLKRCINRRNLKLILSNKSLLVPFLKFVLSEIDLTHVIDFICIPFVLPLLHVYSLFPPAYVKRISLRKLKMFIGQQNFNMWIYRIFSNLIRISFCQFLKRKNSQFAVLIRTFPSTALCAQLLQKSRGGCRLHGKPSRRALSSDLSRSVA